MQESTLNFWMFSEQPDKTIMSILKPSKPPDQLNANFFC